MADAQPMPSCVDVEMYTLGYCLLNAGYLDTCRGLLESDHFVQDRHRVIWDAICALYDVGTSVERVTVCQELARLKKLDAIGGVGYIATLDDGLPDRPGIDNYLDQLQESRTRRRIIYAARHIANMAYDSTSKVEAVIEKFGSSVADLFGTSSANRPINTHEMIERFGISELLRPRQDSGIKLPWPPLQEALGGMEPGQMIMLLGATGKGKTSLALQIATYAAIQNGCPSIWSMEMSAKANFQRMVTQISGVYALKQFMTSEEKRMISEAVQRLDGYPIYFDTHSRSVAAYVAGLRQIRAKGKLGMAIVDHVQLIRSSTPKNRAQEVSENSRALKLAAMDLEIPMLVLSQVDRASVKGDGEIGLHSGKESGDLENDADIVLAIKGAEFVRGQDTSAELWVLKQREGPSGFSIPMVFRCSTQTFMEMGK